MQESNPPKSHAPKVEYVKQSVAYYYTDLNGWAVNQDKPDEVGGVRDALAGAYRREADAILLYERQDVMVDNEIYKGRKSNCVLKIFAGFDRVYTKAEVLDAYDGTIERLRDLGRASLKGQFDKVAFDRVMGDYRNHKAAQADAVFVESKEEPGKFMQLVSTYTQNVEVYNRRGEKIWERKPEVRPAPQYYEIARR